MFLLYLAGSIHVEKPSESSRISHRFPVAGVFGDNNESLEAVRFWPMGRKASRDISSGIEGVRGCNPRTKAPSRGLASPWAHFDWRRSASFPPTVLPRLFCDADSAPAPVLLPWS